MRAGSPGSRRTIMNTTSDTPEQRRHGGNQSARDVMQQEGVGFQVVGAGGNSITSQNPPPTTQHPTVAVAPLGKRLSLLRQVDDGHATGQPA